MFLQKGVFPIALPQKAVEILIPERVAWESRTLLVFRVVSQVQPQN